MKQLLVLKSNADLETSSLVPAEGVLAVAPMGGNSPLNGSAAASGSISLILGRTNGQKPVVITEVDTSTLEVTRSLPYKGVNFSANFTITAPDDGIAHEYVLNLIKKGTVPHERRSWSFTLSSKSTSAIAVGADFIAKFKPQFAKLGLSLQAGAATIKDENVSTMPSGDVHATYSNNDIIRFTGTTAGDNINGHYYKASSVSTSVSWTDVSNQIYIVGDTLTDWNVNGAEQLFGVSISITAAKKAVGDKAYVEDLAKQCAYDRGFGDTFQYGATVNPGYYEEAENFTLNTSGTGSSSNCGYAIYTLRFKNARHAAKTRDEKVWQIVHIAAPLGYNNAGSSITTATTKLNTLFGIS